MAASIARKITLQALVRWDESSRYAEAILDDLARRHSLDSRDRAFAQNLLYGILRNLTRIDFIIDRLRRGRVGSRLRAVLRLGLYQLLDTRVPDHAAVNETVALAPAARRAFVNAILRQALRRRDDLEAELARQPLAVRASHPGFLVQRWQSRLGAETAALLCDWNNRPAPVCLRLNRLRSEAELEPVLASPDLHWLPGHPDFFTLDGPVPDRWHAGGLVYAQDPSTTIACRLLDPPPGGIVLDACAAPGGKTALLAQLMQHRGTLFAVEKQPARLDRLTANLARLGAAIARPVHHDWQTPGLPAPLAGHTFDAILVDAPCSNTGVLRRRVDARWRLDPGEFARMQSLQLDLLEACLPLLKPGAPLVYSTCSIEPEENSEVVEKLLAHHPRLALAETCDSLPWRDQTDGAFAARLIDRPPQT